MDDRDVNGTIQMWTSKQRHTTECASMLLSELMENPQARVTWAWVSAPLSAFDAHLQSEEQPESIQKINDPQPADHQPD